MTSADRTKPTTLRMQATKRARPLWLQILLTSLKWGTLCGLLLAAIGTATLAVLFWVYGSDPDLPRISTLKEYHPKQTTRILSADGKVIGEIFEERRTFVPIDKIAPLARWATIDAEDADFYQHGGISVWGMVRALWVDLRSGKRKQGASTITQQVVKTFVLSPEKTLKRKLQEIILARRLEKALEKDEILTLYLNQIYYGHGRYGIEEAALFYFAKHAADLNAGEAATLAGLPQSPERLSPLKHPDECKRRQTYVLEQMVKRGHLGAEEAQKWIDAPILAMKEPEPSLSVAPEFVEVVKKELERRYGSEVEAARAGVTVYTTLDTRLEKAARESLEAGLRALDERHKYRGPVEKLKPEKVAERLKLMAKELPASGPRSGDTYDAVVAEVREHELVVDLGGWTGAVLLDVAPDARYNPEKKKAAERFARNDLVRVRVAPPELGKPKAKEAKGALLLDQGPQAAMVVIDPVTRHVLAMVGGYDFSVGGFDRALRSKRQPGSSFKPILYAAALDSGQFTPASIVNDAPEVYNLWKPKNYEREGFLGPVRLRVALAHSINTVAIRVMHDVTPERAVEMAHALGIKSELPKELSLALGSGECTPLELVNAYTTIAAGGQLAPPVFIAALGDDKEKPVEPTQALRPEVAYVLTKMMESVITEGTGSTASKLHRTLAGKTGTSNSGKDTWFIGFSPDLVAGVWVGFDDMRNIGSGETGAKAALPIWIDFMKVALKDRPASSFPQPKGVITARIDKRTGLLAAPGEPDKDVLEEYFLDGNAPTETAPSSGEVDPSTFVIEQQDDETGAANAPPDPRAQ